jgi:proteasome lid subunit RPN8/RPN11
MNNFGIRKYLKKIKQLCLEKAKEEVCGLIYLSKISNEIIVERCENISSCKRDRFLIHPKDYQKILSKGKIVACFHSHIKGAGFSSEDIRSSLDTKILYVLYNVLQNKFYFFDPIKNAHYKKYIDIRYIYGINDCWSTIGRYINTELKIPIEDPQPDRIFKKDDNTGIWNSWDYETRKVWMKKSGLIKIIPKSRSEIKKNDLLVLGTSQEIFPTWGALVLEDNLMLHHSEPLPHLESKIEYLRDAYIKRIIYVGRFAQ